MLPFSPNRTILSVALLGAVCVLALAGCGGQLAKPGCAVVTQVCPNGALLLQYSDGHTDWKHLDFDNAHKESRELAKHLLQPARVVETDKGSTITFPSGDTFIYRDYPTK